MKIGKNMEETKCCKRTVLREVAENYDPLGLLAPVTLRAKLFVQQLWREGFGWDEPLPEALHNEWKQIRQRWGAETYFEIERYLPIDGNGEGTELHIFVDASKEAYAAVAYLKVALKKKQKST